MDSIMFIPRRINNAIYLRKLLFMNYIVYGNNITKHVYKALKTPKEYTNIDGQHKVQDYTTKCLKDKNLDTGSDGTYKENNIKKSVEINNLSQSKYNNTEVKLLATTAKQNEEKLQQKLEKIEDVPLVPQTPNVPIQGFNNLPKILNTVGYWQLCNFTEVKSNYYFTNSYYDDIAMRCINSQAENIDECILKELNKHVPEQACSDSKLQNVGKNYYVKWSRKKFIDIKKKYSSGKICDDNFNSRQVSNHNKYIQEIVAERGTCNSNTAQFGACTHQFNTINKPSEIIDNTIPPFHVKEGKPGFLVAEPCSSNALNNQHSKNTANKTNIYTNILCKEPKEKLLMNQNKHYEPGKTRNVITCKNRQDHKTDNFVNYNTFTGPRKYIKKQLYPVKPLYQVEDVDEATPLRRGMELTDANLIATKSNPAKFLKHVQVKLSAGKYELHELSTARSKKYPSKRSVTNILDYNKCLNHVQVKFNNGLFELHSLNTQRNNFNSLWEKSATNNFTKIDIAKLQTGDANNRVKVGHPSDYLSMFSKVAEKYDMCELDKPKTAKSRAYLAPIKAANGNLITIDYNLANCLNHIKVNINSEDFETHGLNLSLRKNLNKHFELTSNATIPSQNREIKPEKASQYELGYLLNKPLPDSLDREITACPKTEEMPHEKYNEANIQGVVTNGVISHEIRQNSNICPSQIKQDKEMTASEMLVKVRERSQSKCPSSPCKKGGKPKPSNPCSSPKAPRSPRKTKSSPNPCAPGKRGGCGRFSSLLRDVFSNEAYIVRLNTSNYNGFPVLDIPDIIHSPPRD